MYYDFIYYKFTMILCINMKQHHRRLLVDMKISVENMTKLLTISSYFCATSFGGSNTLFKRDPELLDLVIM